MKKIIGTPENPNGIEIELTAEEITQRQADEQKTIQEMETAQAKKTENNNLKASAKAKLIAGEPLTEEEADTIVL
mgnify:CR=1 FL=1